MMIFVPLQPGVLATPTPPALTWSVVQSDQDRISLVDLEKELNHAKHLQDATGGDPGDR